MTQAATQRWIEVLGEAASHVSDGVQAANPEVPWRKVIGTRIILAHACFHIDQDIVGSKHDGEMEDATQKGATVNNGVTVRRLNVLHTSEYRRTNWVLTVIDLIVAQQSPGWEEMWHWLVVRDPAGEIVARRRFAKAKEANEARQRFVTAVEALDDEGFADTDWQTLLDSV